MNGRGLIKSQIIDSWNGCIETDYARQRINSERSLQAAFWAQLNALLGANRRLFIEPRVSAKEEGETKTVYPDIVVCNTKEVIAVVELKYLPRGKPSYLKDVRNLDFLARKREGITVANSRYSGPEVDSKEYTLSKNILFVWAGVHMAQNEDQHQLYSEHYPSLKGSFLELHAATQQTAVPEVYYYE
ncbi:MAG: hypothetical protein N0C84_09840 [Candidatus Thiodiazotropha taylori]|uniref:Uncharacterized protein n=1 Tax=Candidatus Thiodiazotropha taylori TaxID=2792791 RepID=A0A9E4N3C1_9GAMM|nr:hypothetical protein [Candidatus Thiodiazotropha taylori]MCW4256748.1 hypothetical protein [Candidatus Thiodiazotropha taylori]